MRNWAPALKHVLIHMLILAFKYAMLICKWEFKIQWQSWVLLTATMFRWAFRVSFRFFRVYYVVKFSVTILCTIYNFICPMLDNICVEYFLSIKNTLMVKILENYTSFSQAIHTHEKMAIANLMWLFYFIFNFILRWFVAILTHKNCNKCNLCVIIVTDMQLPFWFVYY